MIPVKPKSIFLAIVKPAVVLFALIGFADVMGRYLLMPFIGTFFGLITGQPHDVEIKQVIPSPDGSMKAIVYAWTGTAMNAGCEDFVSVVPSWKSEKLSWGKPDRVYSAECNELGSIQWEPPAEGRVRSRLRINADPAKANAMSRLALEGTVSVAFANDR